LVYYHTRPRKVRGKQLRAFIRQMINKKSKKGKGGKKGKKGKK
jgi:hypothetical protein